MCTVTFTRDLGLKAVAIDVLSREAVSCGAVCEWLVPHTGIRAVEMRRRRCEECMVTRGRSGKYVVRTYLSHRKKT